MNRVSIKDVEHIAGLARIKLNEKEKEKMASELGVILGYIDKLKEVNTDGVEPIARPVKSVEGGAAERQFNGASITGLENVMRVDKENKKPLEDQAADAAKLTEMAPDKKNNFVKVPAVFGE